MEIPNRSYPRAVAMPPRCETDPVKLISDIKAGFEEFKAKHDKRYSDIEAAIGQSNESIMAARLGVGYAPAAGRYPGQRTPAPITGDLAAGFHDQMRGLPNATMTTQSDPDGGYAVPNEVDGVIDTVVRDLTPLRNLARVVTMSPGRGSWEKIVGQTGSQTAWAGEEDSRDDTNTPTLRKVTIDPHEVYAIPELTNHILEDSAFDLNGFLAEDVGGEFSLVESTAFVSGDGVKKPRGFLSYEKVTTSDATRPFGKMQYVPSGEAAGFVAPTTSVSPVDALINLISAVRAPYRKGAGVAWLMNSVTANLVRKFKDADGRFLWADSIIAGQPDRLLGYPVEIEENMPNVEANAYPIAFGNWLRGYAIVDKPGMKLIVDRVTKKGWTKLYFAKRVGGGLVDSNAIKLLKIATT